MAVWIEFEPRWQVERQRNPAAFKAGFKSCLAHHKKTGRIKIRPAAKEDPTIVPHVLSKGFMTKADILVSERLARLLN
jgi:hypothetical protein